MNHSGEIYTHWQILVKKTPDYDRAFEILKSEINRAHSTFIKSLLILCWFHNICLSPSQYSKRVIKQLHSNTKLFDVNRCRIYL